MKIELIDGIYNVIMENGDKMFVRTSDPDRNGIKLTNQNDLINISGNGNIVGTISGSSFTDKMEFEKTLSAREVVGKCDEWISTFKDIFEKFKLLLQSQKVVDNHIRLSLGFYQSFESHSKREAFGIRLNLLHYGTLFHEGITISIDNNLNDIYKYLAANVIEFFLAKEYNDRPIDLMRFDWTLTSEDGKTGINLGTLQRIPGMSDVIYQLIAVHNTGVVNEQIFSNLINGIDDAVIGEMFDSSINKAQNDIKLLGKTND